MLAVACVQKIPLLIVLVPDVPLVPLVPDKPLPATAHPSVASANVISISLPSICIEEGIN